MSDPESLQALASQIRATDALGRSQLIHKLFDYLIECSAAGRAPKEPEVAIEACATLSYYKSQRVLWRIAELRGHSDPERA